MRTVNRIVPHVRGVVLVAVVVGTLVAGCDGRGAAWAPIDLAALIDRAERRPAGAPVEVGNVEIAGTTERAIGTAPVSRIIWRLRIPPGAELRTGLAVDPRAAQDGGVLFRIGLSDGRTYEELLNTAVDPTAGPEDRRWIPAVVNMSRYGGTKLSLFYHPAATAWELIFNASPATPGGIARPLWGRPTIVPRGASDPPAFDN